MLRPETVCYSISFAGAIEVITTKPKDSIFMSSNFRRTPSRNSAFGGRRRTYNSAAKSSNRRPGSQYIDPARFVRAAKSLTAEVYIPQFQFDDFAVHPLIKA